MTEANHSPDFIKKRNKFRAFHHANPKVWEKFCLVSDELLFVGSKASAWLVVNQMRWLHFFETKGDEFKLPNDHIAFYARAYMKSETKRRGLFEIRPMNGEDFNNTRQVCGV